MEGNTIAKGIFDSFVRQYSLSKTVRFKLKPIWSTQKMLDEEHIFETDELRHEKYERTKPWIDRLHREFIKEALSDFSFKSLILYRKTFEVWQKDKKSKSAKDNLAKEENKLREEIVEKFNATAKGWAGKYPELKLKKVDVGILFEAGIFRVLKERYENESGTAITTNGGDGVNIFDDWNGWTGYFKKFFQTRKNFYSAGNESTSVAYRIVNQNLRRFIQNIQLFDQAKHKIDVTKIEKDLDISCDKIFSLENYSVCLLQNGIDAYNRAIGGEIKGRDKKIPGINQAINEYRQKNKNDKIHFLTMLNKQIHSEKEKFLDAIEDDKELIRELRLFAKAANTKLGVFRKLISDFTSNNDSYILDKVYISSDALERNASRWFANYESFEQALLDTVKEYEDAYSVLDQKPPHEKDGQIKYPDFLIYTHIKSALDKVSIPIFKEKYYEEIPRLGESQCFEQFLHILQFEVEQQFSHKDLNGRTAGYEIHSNNIKSLLGSLDFKIDKDAKIAIKNFVDSTLAIYQLAKYFAVEKRRQWLDNFDLDDRFYNDTDVGYMTFYGDAMGLKSAYEEIVQGYNALRNYLTRKPYSTDKWILNFNIPTLADGFDRNKEKENGVVVLRKNGQYYLGVMDSDHMNLFAEEKQKELEGDGYEKMNYKYFPNPSQMIPKCSTQLSEVKKHFSKSTEDYYLKSEAFIIPLRISKKIFDLNNFEYQKSYLETLNGSDPDESRRVRADSQKKNQVKLFQKDVLELSKNERVYKSALKEWIDFCKEFLKSYESTTRSGFDYSHIRPTVQYSSVDQFYRDIEKGSYKVTFTPISESYLRSKNTGGELFVFEIHNKDWNLKDGKRKEGTKNLHTLYWEQLFSNENATQNFVFKLNGEAELFFRPKTEESKLGYKKWDVKEKKWMKVIKKENEAVVDRKRYAESTILFHCLITINRVSENKTDTQMNTDIRKVVAEKKEIRIIGVDRGEKHLAYYSVINQNGEIISNGLGSLNTVGVANGKPVPYAEILEKRMKERETARREWQEIEQIKDTKRGYVSQVVHKLVDLAIEHNAIIVLEDLSMRFKQVRSGIEKSIYQQFEKQLIDKLSFLVNKKETNPTKAGHPLRAYQLTSPITAFKKMGKQTGMIFYTAAGYTSRTCPVCGYRRNIHFRFENVDKAKEIIRSLEGFTYNAKNDSFVISYSLKKFLSKEQQKENKTKNKLYENKPRKDIFTLFTKDAIRYKWFQQTSPRLRAIKDDEGIKDYQGTDKQQTKRGLVKEFDINKYLKGLLKNILRVGDLREVIISYEVGKEFYEKLLFALFLLTETRQSVSETDVDYIHCPECGFDSRKGFQGNEFNGDANGAYNIARKGIMILEKIKQFKEKEDLSKMGWSEMSISIEEWDKFTQSQWNLTSKSQK